MNSSVNLGVDIDDVIADFVSTLVLFHNHFYGSNLTKNDFFSCDFWDVWGGSKEDAVRKVDEMFNNPNYFAKIPIIEQSFSSLTVLKKQGFCLYAITGRRNNMINQTLEWLAKHFPEIFSDVFFSNSYCPEGKDKKKSEICKRIGVDIIVEDHLKHALDCSQNGIKVFLFDNPWNKLFTPSGNITRVFGWNDIINELQ